MSKERADGLMDTETGIAYNAATGELRLRVAVPPAVVVVALPWAELVEEVERQRAEAAGLVEAITRGMAGDLGR